MKLEKIITLASQSVRLRLLAMVRSLRGVGCDLPVWVIPYSDAPEQQFALPDGCQWWKVPAVCDWLATTSASPLMRRYQCFLEGNYQFVDTDVIFLHNPATVLSDHSGFVASCGHWRDPDHALIPESVPIFRRATTTWQRRVFNSGQFACDRPLFADLATLRRTAEDPVCAATCFYPLADQPGVNLLQLVSGVPYSNLTLPPTAMESTWAGDYDDADYAQTYWQDEARKPYLIHWAGVPMNVARPIHELYYNYLTPEERTEWSAEVRRRLSSPLGLRMRFQPWRVRAHKVWRALLDG